LSFQPVLDLKDRSAKRRSGRLVLVSGAMIWLRQLVLFVHVASAMVWLGGTLFVARRAGQALQLEGQARVLSFGQLLREARVFTSASGLVFLTGLGLLALIGFANLSPRYHAALTLTLIWVALDHAIVRRSLLSLASGLPDAAPLAVLKRLRVTLGVQHLLFTVTLVLMLWRL
jgi:hypothetical protein